MKFFYVDCGPAFEDQVLVSGEHKWILPGLICPICGIWGGSGREFPCIEPTQEQRRYFKKGPQPLDWFKEAFPKSGLRQPDGSIPGPTTQFGPLEGRVESGRIVTDFIWPRSWTILVRQLVKDLLATSDLRISCFAQARIKGSAKLNEKFHELQIERGLFLDDSCMQRSGPDCKLCGRSPVRLGSGPLKLRKGAPSLHEDLFRAANFPTLIFASEPFVSFANKQSFSNIAFQLVELAP
jgi:hypothetical protein